MIRRALLILFAMTVPLAAIGVGFGGVPCVGSGCGGGASTGCPAGDTSCVEVATTPDICAGLQTAFNELLDPNQVGGIPAEVTVVAPAPGTYDCDQRVRVCLSSTTTSGANAPACNDTTTAYPEVHFAGEWDRVRIDGAWTADPGTNVHTPAYWQPSTTGPDAMIWIGDLHATENVSRLVPVRGPKLWVESGGSGYVASAWRRNIPLFCDGCTGWIGYKSRSPDLGASLRQHQFAVLVGRRLAVDLDVQTPVWSFQGTSQHLAVIGDRITVSGTHHQTTTDAGSAMHFGYGGVASESVFYKVGGDHQAYGATGAVAFAGHYETTADFVGANGVNLANVTSAVLRGEFGRRGAAGGTNKPWVDGQWLATRQPHIELLGLFHADPAGLNANVRLAGTDATTVAQQVLSRPRLVVGGRFDMSNFAATLGGQAPIHCHTTQGNIPCEIELLLSAARIGSRYQWVHPSYFRQHPQFGGQRVLHPARTVRTVTVSGTGVSGNCVKGLNGGATSIGACAAEDAVTVTEPTVINYQRLDLLEARPGSSQCILAVEQTVHPGVATWVNGPTEARDCTAADTPHTGCTGAGAGASLRAYSFAHRKLEYGRAATASVYQRRTTEIYDYDETAGSAVLHPGQSWRVVAKPFRTCSGGSAGLIDTLGWQCAINADCVSPNGSAGSRTCNTVGTCGDLGLSRITVETFPALKDAQCWDGIDNDADGLVDYPQDAGCANYDDDAE
jgi:hypothetical protein